MLYKILLLVAVGFSTVECTPYPEPKASSVIPGRVLRSSVEVAPIAYQQSTQFLPAAYAYSAYPAAPLAATIPYQPFAYATSPYYATAVTATLPSPPPFSYSRTPSTYTRSVTQQYAPAVATAPVATPAVVSPPYSHTAVYSSPYSSIPAAGRTVQAITQAVGPSGQYLG